MNNDRHALMASEVRGRLLNHIILAAAILGFPALLAAVIGAVSKGQWIDPIIFFFSYLPVVFITPRKNKLSFEVRASVISGSMFLLAVFCLARFGLSGAGFHLLLTLCVLTTVLFGIRAGLIWALISMVSIATVGSGMVSGSIPANPTLLFNSTNVYSWVSLGTLFALLATIVVTCPGILLKELLNSIDLLEGRTGELSDVNQKLKQEIEIRGRAEDDLRKSEEQYRLVVENANEGIILTREGRFIYINPKAKEFMGISEGEFKSMNMIDLIHPEDREMIVDLYIAKMRGEYVPLDKAYRVMTKQGDVRWVSSRSAVITYENEPALLTFLVDITQRKKAQEALVESEKRFRSIFETIENIPVQGYDSQRNVIYWNPASEKVYGYSSREALGNKLEDLIIPPPMREAVVRDVSRWVDDGVPIPAGELELLGKNGSMIPVYSSHVVITNHQGEKEMYCIDLDLTDIKQAEAEKKKLEAQLQQAHKMEAIGTLAGGIAHDFNNMLQAINGYAQILLHDKSESHPDFNGLTTIEQTGRKAAELVRQLLLFSRKAGASHQTIDLNYEIQQAVCLLERTIPKMIEIELHLDEQLMNIQADPLQIEQLLLNIGSNAADAMPHGGKLTIETQNMMADEDNLSALTQITGEHILLRITDTGHGINREDMEHIFQPFFTTKEIGKGTGLGLASVYGIVKGHGGLITCESEVEQGTTFRIYLPASENNDVAPALEQVHEKQFGHNETILVVDDEESVRSFVSQALTRFGYQVVASDSGEEAVDVFKSDRKIDLVLLDLGMPGMGGQKCLRELLAVDPNVKVIITSGYSLKGQVEQTLDEGAMEFIQKPIALPVLLNRVRDVLGRAMNKDVDIQEHVHINH